MLRAQALLPKRVEEFKGVPTFAEAGIPGIDILGWRGVAGPPNLPGDIIKKWVDAMEKLTKDKEWIDAAQKLGDIPGYLGPKEFKEMVEKEYILMKGEAKALGIL
jgi:tripartite-type tricarboxylate transporter receptor subunit TctC